MSAEKQCPSCGASNDTLLTNCLFCKSSLPHTDPNSITPEELVLKCGEWIGRLSNIRFYPGPKFGIKIQAPPGYKPPMSLNSLIGQDGGGIFIDRAEVVGNAEKYLALLRVRATTNPQLESTLRHYDEAYSAYKNKKSGGLVGLVKGMLFGRK